MTARWSRSRRHWRVLPAGGLVVAEEGTGAGADAGDEQ